MTDKKCVSKKISLLLLTVLGLLILLDILSGFVLKNITNFHKILIYCVIFLLPMAIYIKAGKYKPRKILKLSHVKIRYLPFIILFGLSVSIICALINALSSAVFSNLFTVTIPTSTVSFTSGSALVIGITHVFLPAFCEELLIRGIALSEYEKYGVPISIILTSVIFALFHASAVTFLSLLVAGICYAVLTHLFKSVWPAIFCHCINNALSVYLSKSSEFIKYLSEDFIFIVFLCLIVFIVLYLTLRLSEQIVDELGDKNRLKTNTKRLVYGEPLSSVYIWIFFILSVIMAVKNTGIF